MEGPFLRGAGWTPWAVGSWEWEAVCPGQSSTTQLYTKCNPFSSSSLWTEDISVYSSLVTVLPQDDHGKFNFDQSKVINPETGEPVSFCLSPRSCLTSEIGPKRWFWWLCLSGVELVSGKWDVGQQILHDRLFLWRMSRRMCRPLPVPQQTSAEVSKSFNVNKKER